MHRLPLIAGLAMLASLVSAQASGPKAGYLGQATGSTRIYASPNSHSKIFSKVPPQRYLVIKQAPVQGWYAVLLQSGVYGFVPSKSVKVLPWDVRFRNYETRGQYAMNQSDLASRSAMVSDAMNYVGTPYKWGGTDPNTGIDCSGFVKNMYGKIGLNLPRTAAEQALVGQPIYRLEDLKPGDRLYFWEAKRGMIGHTGIYQGDGKFIHSSHGHGGVATDYLTPGWRRILVAARR
jgi:hypothetical protein